VIYNLLEQYIQNYLQPLSGWLKVEKENIALNSLEVAHTIIDVLEDKKGENILLLDIREVTTIADYFVICSGTSDRMLDALAEEVRREIRTRHQVRPRVEGDPQTGWVLVDYGNIVLHLFAPDRRDFYRLEDLWSEGKVVLHLQ
jgi:ribosome-associated protein